MKNATTISNAKLTNAINAAILAALPAITEAVKASIAEATPATTTPKKPRTRKVTPKSTPKAESKPKAKSTPKSVAGQVRLHGREKYGVVSGEDIPAELKPIVEALVKGGEKPEVRGRWIWVTSPKPAKGLKKGDKDVPPRQALLWELGFRYSAKSAQWYYAPRKKSTAE